MKHQFLPVNILQKIVSNFTFEYHYFRTILLFLANEVTCDEEDGHISYHADKADCRMYYMCEGERKHHMPCPSNLVFNPDQNVCDWPENVEGCMQHTAAPPTKR